MAGLFSLTDPDERSRADIDATLVIEDRQINFELKSTTGRLYPRAASAIVIL